ncbi:MAG: hypothetical protein EAZ35_09370 [Sphingobacteriia bacterium]|nr:MAG: hypothetical protein EAZ35_09370 [Sphingobacteriia bacterium]
MKYIQLTAIALVFFIKSQAQITKNNWMLGGNISFSSTNYKSANYGAGYTLTSLKVDPNIGYFFADRFAVGLKSTISRVSGVSYYSLYTIFSAGPFLRYYFLPKENRINILAEGLYQYGFEEGDQVRIPKHLFAFSTGAVAFFNSSVGIEFLLSYTNYRLTTIAGNNGILQLGLGLQVHLNNY